MTDKTKTAEEGSETTITTDAADLQAEIEKLRAKNKELLTEKQKAKQKAQEAQDAADEAATQAAERNGDIEALKTAHAKEIQKLQDKLNAVDTDLRTIRVDNEISKALTEGNVRSEMADALTALFKNKVDYSNGVATIEGKFIAEYAAEYLGSAVGAHFRRASDNSGAGATGNSSTTAPLKLTKRPSNNAEWEYLDSLPDAERNSLCDANGWDDLKV